MKNLTKMKFLKKTGILSLLYSTILLLSFTSCSEDSVSNTDEGETISEAESAWLISYRNETPQGRVYFMEVKENIPPATDLDNAVELGLNNSRIIHFGEHGYVYNDAAATITKWEADKETLELSVSGVVSLAASGISGSLGDIEFVSEEQAFVEVLDEAAMVEFNPSTMTITKVHNVTPLPDVGVNISAHKIHKGAGNKILMPIAYSTPKNCCAGSDLPSNPGAMIAVFDTQSGTIEYKTDDRLYTNGSTLLRDPVTGQLYANPLWSSSMTAAYFDTSGIADNTKLYNLLRVNDDGSFDPDFSVDLSEVDGINEILYLRKSVFVFNNKLVITYLDASSGFTFPSAFSDRWSKWSEMKDNFKSVIIDLDTKEATSYDEFSAYNGAFPMTTVDGSIYYSAVGPNDKFDILRQDGVNSLTVVSSHDGTSNFRHLGKLW